MQRVDRAGSRVQPHCHNDIYLGRSLFGERRDAFVVSLRMVHQDADVVGTCRTGFRELFTALWDVEKTTSCEHTHAKDTELILSPGFTTLSGYNDNEPPTYDERVLICLTTNNDVAKWRVLIALLRGRQYSNSGDYRWIMLRSSRCCLECALLQASFKSRKCVILL